MHGLVRIKSLLIVVLALLSAWPGGAAGKVVCDQGSDAAYLSVKQQFGDPRPGENLEQRVLFEQFRHLYNQHLLISSSNQMIASMRAEAAAMDQSMARLKKLQTEYQEFQDALPPAERRLAMPVAPCDCALGFAKSFGDFERQANATMADVRKAMDAKLNEACAAQDVEDETIAAGQRAEGVVTLVNVELQTSRDGWSVDDGKITLTRPGYSGAWSWAPPPAEIPVKGFARLLRVTATAEKGSSFNTGIEFSTNLSVVNGAKPAYVSAQSGTSQTNSTVMTIAPFPGDTLRKGDKFWIHIAASYFGGVKYHYVVK